MTTTLRAAILAALLLIAAAALVTFTPSHYEVTNCRTWVNPDWTIPQGNDMADTLRSLGRDDVADRAIDVTHHCTSQLATRRLWTLTLLGLAVLIIPATTFITRGIPDRQQTKHEART